MNNNNNNGLSLSMNVNDNDGIDSEDDADMRQTYGFNSPKANKHMTFGDADEDDNKNMGLALDDVDQNCDVTPNTQKRVSANVNSPRANAGLQALMTQVQRPEKNSSGGGGGAESLVTQVSRDQTEDNIRQNQMTQPPSGGICSCMSCLFNCCSGPAQVDIELQEESMKPNNSDSQLVGSGNGNINQQSNQNANGTAGTSNSGSAETATQPLVGAEAAINSGNGGNSNSNNNQNDNNYDDEEDDTYVDDSRSSTEYDNMHLLPPLPDSETGKKCLILDLDETLVHSSFKPIPNPHFIIPVEIDNIVHHVYVLKRPYCDEFMLKAAKDYEIVIFTASLSKYADPLLDKLDIHNVIAHRLFRESCVIHGTAYVKDLRKLGRKLKDSIIVDNSPPSYLFQPTNAIPIASWFDDEEDTQLNDLLPVLETTLKEVKDVRCILDANVKTYRWLCNQSNKDPKEFRKRND